MTDRSALRLVVLRVLVVSILLTLLGRLGYLQVAEGDKFSSAAFKNRVREIVTPAARGQILDARGKPLVSNRTDLVVSVTRSIVRSQKDKGADVLNRLYRVVGIPADQIALLITPCGERIKKGVVARSPNCWNGSPLQPVPIKSYRADDRAQIRKVLAIEEHAEDFPGISVNYAAVREYPQGSLAAHVLGYLGPLSQDEAKKDKYKGRPSGSVIGRSGVEAVYDDQLRGVDGVQRLQVDLNSTVTGELGKVDPTAGDNLVLSIDSGIQKAAEDALASGMAAARKRFDKQRARHFIAPKGTAVVVDVTNGQVVAMASNPTYEPAKFVPRISKADYDLLTSTPGDPLTNAATQGLFAPGSTFKIVSTAAGVAAGNSINGLYPCPSQIKLGNRVFHNFEGESSKGNIDFRTTLIKSCDTVYYQLAYDEWVRDNQLVDVKKPARERFPKMARDWGFGSKSGIDLPDERIGTITDRAYKQHYWEQNKNDGFEYCRHAKQGYPAEPDKARAAYLTLLAKEFCTDGYRYNAGDAALFAIGQGDVLVTPVQLAMAYAALANGGTVYEPRLAKGFLSADGRTYALQPPVTKAKLPVSPGVLGYIRNALLGVTQPGGTAQGAFAGFPMGQLPVAGKTGTADVLNKAPTSWFASFAPANKPRYAMVVMVTEAGTGGTTAAPISRRIWSAMYGIGGHKALLDPDGQLPATLPVVKDDGMIAPPGTAVAHPPRLRPAATISPSPSATQALGAPYAWRPERRTGWGPS